MVSAVSHTVSSGRSGLPVISASRVNGAGAMDAPARPFNPIHKPIASGSCVCKSPSLSEASFRPECRCRWVQQLRHTRDATTMGEQPSTQSHDQQDQHIGTGNGPSVAAARQLAQQLRQLELPAVLESSSHDEATNTPRSRARLVGTQSLATTQTLVSPRTMALQSRGPLRPSSFGHQLADAATLQSTAHWPSGTHAHTSARVLMWDQVRQQLFHSQSSPQAESSFVPLASDSINSTAAARFVPQQDGRVHTVGDRGVYTTANQPLSVSTASQPDEKTEDMEIDALLDDDSLDMLVTTLARETAKLEASHHLSRQSVHHHHRNHRHEEDEGDEEEDDNQRSEQDHGDDSEFSSAESSDPSTPSTSSSNSKSIMHRQGKGKAKPKRVRRACVIPGCGKRSRSLGLCIAHGGGRRCAVSGCDKSSQGGNLCIKHGGGKRCSVEGCEKAAQTNSLCKAHGGGPRCQFGDCQKSSQGGGFCRQHGGGKRCAFQGCMKGTQRGSYCALHGGSRLCIVDGCQRNDRGGGYCAHHGGGRRCTVPECPRPSRRNALCSTHLRVLGSDGHNLDELNESIDRGIRRTLASRTPSPSPSPPPSPYPPSNGR